jgi:hypothetical protein
MVLRAIVGMVAAVSLLVTASHAEAGAFEDCGQRVIRDWYSGGRVDKVYPLPCYREAIRALPDDVMQYTDAGAAIERALESARHRTSVKAERITDAAGAETADPAPSAAPARRPSPPAPPPAAKAVARPANDLARLAAGPAHATHDPGLPYPLIALGALSAVLLVSGVAAGLARRGR